jgi:2-methylisocitrate lyase-like PEP mutase family enzyme
VSLRNLLAGHAAVVAPGAYDALSALLVEQAGFQAVYVSGASIAYTQLGRPDIGLVSASEVVNVVARMRDRVAIPLIVDADTGYGNALNVQRTVSMLEGAGANAIQIEDQQSPKRCGHLQGKALVTCEEMSGKVRAAVDARRDPATLIIARTDAIAVEGLEGALERAERYLEAGADVLFVEAPQSMEQIRAVTGAFARRAPLVANMVEGGRTPMLSQAQLTDLGFRLVIAPGALVRAFAFMAREFLAVLAEDGSSARYRDRMVDLAGINAIIGLEDMLSAGVRYGSSERLTAAE